MDVGLPLTRVVEFRAVQQKGIGSSAQSGEVGLKFESSQV
jgi:hypothetical protein